MIRKRRETLELPVTVMPNVKRYFVFEHKTRAINTYVRFDCVAFLHTLSTSLQPLTCSHDLHKVILVPLRPAHHDLLFRFL